MFVFLTGIPIAFGFLLMNMIGVYIFWGGEAGLLQLVESIVSSETRFILLPLPLFILMGELMFRTGSGQKVIGSLDKWIGRVPGRLGLLAVGSGVLLSTTTGTTQAATAVLGELLVPDMERLGYKKPMSLGPVLGSGGLAIMIPPSALGVFLAALAEISVGGVLIGAIIPGLCMATLYASYIIIRCWLQPSVAPAYEIAAITLFEKIRDTVKYVLPLGIIVFLVVGVIMIGVATPSEAAATGALGTAAVSACYGGLHWETMKKAFAGTIRVSAMIFMLIAGAQAFSQVLSFSGATRGLGEFAVGLHLSPLMLTIAMMAVVLILGMFMSGVAVLMVLIPIFIPVARTVGIDPLWLGLLLLLATEMAFTSPPFGMSLFVMKAVAPPDTTLGDCYRAAVPFLLCDLIVMGLIMAFPQIALWLPSLMR